MLDAQKTIQNLITHVEHLTKKIGERSVSKLWRLEESAQYIEAFYKTNHIEPRRETYEYRGEPVSNIVADIILGDGTGKIFLVGAHYDSVRGTVGADDNASAVSVQLEVAKELARLKSSKRLNHTIKFVSFPLEEPPAYATRKMGSRVYARKARMAKERIDGMICLEMVGYTCHEPGCQSFPFPLMFMGYPKIGNFIGIIGNFKSRDLTQAIYSAFKLNDDLPVEKLNVPGNGYLIPNIRLSDHASFWDKGYKAVMITDTAFYRNPHYHLSSDTMDKLDFSFMAQLVQSLVIFFCSDNS